MCHMVGPDLLLILIVILFILIIWRGPKMLPQLGEALGKTIKGVRSNIGDDSDKPDEDAKTDPDKAVTTADPEKDDADPKSGG